MRKSLLILIITNLFIVKSAYARSCKKIQLEELVSLADVIVEVEVDKFEFDSSSLLDKVMFWGWFRKDLKTKNVFKGSLQKDLDFSIFDYSRQAEMKSSTLRNNDFLMLFLSENNGDVQLHPGLSSCAAHLRIYKGEFKQQYLKKDKEVIKKLLPVK